MPRHYVHVPIVGLLAAFLSGVLASPGAGQGTAHARTEENVRREPNGVILGRVAPGAALRVVETQGDWTQVDLEGWVWLASLQVSRGDLDLVVSVSGGENLRARPAGEVVGRLQEGVLLDELEREPGWARVRRRVWIWSASVRQAEGGTRPPTASAAASPPSSPVTVPLPTARRPEGFMTVGVAGAPILTAPDGDTLAVAVPDRDLEVLTRQGNWARVRVEGWIWSPPVSAGAPEDAPELTALVPADLARDPARHVGRAVSWALQFISLERAEALRTDFREGEPFLLARFGGRDGPFVYVAVPPDRLAEMEGLVPLERISVTARVRTGASSLTGTPIVDLLTLEKGP